MLSLLFNSAISGSVSSAQGSQSDAIAAAEIFSGTGSSSQASQSNAIAAAEIFAGSSSTSQASQADAIAGAEIFSGTGSSSQASQSDAIAAAEIFAGSSSTSQASQADAIAAAEIFAGDTSTSQASQSDAIAGDSIEGSNPPDVIGSIDSANSPQQTDAAGSVDAPAMVGVGNGSGFSRRIQQPRPIETPQERPAPIVGSVSSAQSKQISDAVADLAISGTSESKAETQTSQSIGEIVDVDLELFAALALAA